MSSKSQKNLFVVKYITYYVYTAVYSVEQFVIQENPRFEIQSCFKSRSDYNGARTVVPEIW